jgi:hypothetical protein
LLFRRRSGPESGRRRFPRLTDRVSEWLSEKMIVVSDIFWFDIENLSSYETIRSLNGSWHVMCDSWCVTLFNVNVRLPAFWSWFAQTEVNDFDFYVISVRSVPSCSACSFSSLWSWCQLFRTDNRSARIHIHWTIDRSIVWLTFPDLASHSLGFRSTIYLSRKVNWIECDGKFRWDHHDQRRGESETRETKYELRISLSESQTLAFGHGDVDCQFSLTAFTQWPWLSLIRIISEYLIANHLEFWIERDNIRWRIIWCWNRSTSRHWRYLDDRITIDPVCWHWYVKKIVLNCLHGLPYWYGS